MLAVDDEQQVIVGGFTFVKNIDLVKLWLEAVAGCLSENRCLKTINNYLKFEPKSKLIINNTASLQPTTLLKMNSLMNLS